MLAFESLTPQELLKEVAEFIDMEALRRSTEVKILDRKSRLTRAEKEKRARAESADNALHSIALELKGAAIIPAGSILRGSFKRRYTETYTPEPAQPEPSFAEKTEREALDAGKRWYLYHTSGEYRDFEPTKNLTEEGFARITFNVAEHTAYATLANPKATLENDEPTYSDESKALTWEQAEELINRTNSDR
jgi:hypothetical protein